MDPAVLDTAPAEALSGRPTSLTPALAIRISERLVACNYPSVAARAVGVPERTFDRWIAKGRADDEAGINSVYAHMWRLLDQKDAEAEIALITAAASGKMGWQGPMTVASRRHAQRWRDEDVRAQGVTINIGVVDSVAEFALQPATACSTLLLADSLNP